MITGAHSIIYSKDPEADRDFFRDVLQLTKVDVGHGWLIFGLPPAEVAVHPSDQNDMHEFYLMCDDIEAFIAEMKAKKVACGDVQDMGWGVLTQLTLPGGGKLGVYQPRHARPEPMQAKAPSTKLQAPSSREAPIIKCVASSQGEFGAWCLVLLWSLGLGIWSFEEALAVCAARDDTLFLLL